TWFTDPVLSLKNGRIRGEVVTVKGTDRRVKQYLGIPFAQPPVGPLRLAAPQEAQPWDGERDCTTQPPMCIQDPQIVVNVSKTMSMHFDTPDISEDCLYLNVYTPEGAAQEDRLPVLFWIHGGGLTVGAGSQYDGSSLAAYENMVIILQLFVTIAGESAGGISASILTLSPLAKGLFQKAIFQSGVATLGKQLVPHYDTCVQIQIYLGAVVDGVFLTDSAEELLKKKEVMKIPVILGITNHEFGWILPQVTHASSANSLIANEYLRDAQSPEDVRDRFTEVIGDLLMTVPVVGVAGYLSDAAVPVYLYEFAYRAELFKDTRPSFVKADHADDVGFVFGACFWNGNIKVIEEETLCRNMMSYWANFARTGSPNGPGLLSWPQFDRQQQAYMELDLTQTVKHKLRSHRVHLITTTLPQKLQELAAAGKKATD
uniref:Carboxylesterase type B domain-containing protein n=1 Tax=Periophthalmus magnuspinnatus TaxID=409849 RepID=A0A3B3ZCX4_9GOBI